MTPNNEVKTLVDRIYADLGLRVTADDPLVMLIYVMQKEQEKTVTAFETQQSNLLAAITQHINSRKRRINWAIVLGLVNLVAVGYLIVRL